MKIYLVGGAIRDELLGLPVKERDWVVVGASPETLLAQNYLPVGKDFPVFLHPDTKEEYALARTERKVGKGYKGFTFHTETNVTLEDDLKRRDLTINAIARSDDGELIDPYGGQADLQKKLLRHISTAFSEDPVRILRVARFAAKLTNFTVFPDTNQLMQDMVNNGEVNALVAERVWQELSRALTETQPTRFFQVLHDCEALPVLFPMIHIDGAGMKALERATLTCKKSEIRFAILMHDIEAHTVKDCCQRYRIPKEYSELAILTSSWHANYQNILQADPETLLNFIKKTDALRRPERFEHFLEACHACTKDKKNKERDSLLKKTIAAIKNIDISTLQQQDLKGKAFADALHNLQLLAAKQSLE